jgi:CRP-like cAMP-binding protein
VLSVMLVRVAAPGELIIREGEVGNSMFVLKQGVAGVRVAAVAADPQGGAGVTEQFRVGMDAQLKALREGGVEEFAFPPDLSNDQRRFVHRHCQEYGLVTESRGEGEARYITVTKAKKRGAEQNAEPPARPATSTNAALDYLGREVAELHEPDFFGELALTEPDSRRTATIVAKSACELLEFPRAGFERLLAACPQFKQGLADRTEALALVKEVPLFEQLPLKIAEEIIALCSKRRYGRGELVIEQGDEADCMFFIKAGTVDVVLAKEGHVATMRPGQFFGERALFEDDQDVRTASVLASAGGDVDLLVLEKDDFVVLLEDFPAFAREVDALSGSLQYVEDAETPAPVGRCLDG